MEMRLGPAARARSLLFPPVVGRAPGGAAPQHPKAALQWPRPPREGPNTYCLTWVSLSLGVGYHPR